MSSSVTLTINQLSQASSMLVLVLSLTSVTLGGIGLIFNILIFIRPPLRREPCVVYFFWSTCFSLILILILQPVRILAVSFGIDQTTFNLGLCKIEWFAIYVTRSASSWFIVLACIDRFFHSSANARVRRMSTLKTARISILVMTIIIFSIHIHSIIYYQTVYQPDRFGNITPSCSPEKSFYYTFLGLWNMVVYSLFPSSLMLLFGLLTLKNIRQQRFIIPAAIDHNQTIRRTDAQLLRMLLAQVIFIIIFTLPLSILQLYSSFTGNFSKTALQLAQESFAFRTASALTYFAHSSTFYMYTVTGTIFRTELFKIVRRCGRTIRNIVSTNRGEIY
ncbi:unnamed protein product [Adineta ricciae]|uniref:G-protein coupled receptors family 1 profile domain-containing protein n=1 Tax=Adineta ricciae TaxID=249248 RepID=A0A814ZNT7_ADIRI|nr:unnamed protein product [Adineta ricciae]CAF1438063.1 unnamed protein product [Adineta ricciae]